ncbi:MAG: Asp-tRNA(Asn)/Glu-tRNA(Gln) amidotransferase subunit GatA [Leptospirales bacterium]
MSAPFTTLASFRKGRDDREFSIEDAVRHYLALIEKLDGGLGSFLTVNPNAVNRARQLDNRLARNPSDSPFYGYPIAIKDNMNVVGLPTTCSSRMLANFRPVENATVVDRLLKAGAVILGKTNMDEFAMGSSTENSAMGVTRNPWDTGRVPGGSSGGSAVAVAAELAPLSLGSDTGGSIRQPAAFCGVLGLKPTYGRVSRYGLVAFSSSLDQIGPFSRYAQDALDLTVLVSGPDGRDMTVRDRDPQEMVREFEGGVRGMAIGMPEEFFGEGLDPEIAESLDLARDVWAAEGAVFKPIRLPSARFGINVYYLIATSEAASNLSRYDGIRYGYRSLSSGDLKDLYQNSRREGFGPEVKRRILLGTFALSAGYQDQYYRKAQQVQALIREEFDRAFHEVDLVFAPTTPTPPFRFGEKISDPLSMYLSDIYTISANLAGLPALSAPSWPTGSGLPVGAQLIGPAWSEGRLLRMARILEEAVGYRVPPMVGQMSGGKSA